jgi:hypothetical protein
MPKRKEIMNMETKTLHYLYQENFDRDCKTLQSRDIQFETDNLSITVPIEHWAILLEFKLTAFTSSGDTIGIVNNSGDCYGHTKSTQLTCPQIAAELFLKASQESRSWYYITNPQNHAFVKDL